MDQSAISGLGVLLHWAVFTAADSQTAEVLGSQIAPKINVRLGLCRRRGERGGEASYRRMERQRESSLCGGISWRSGEDGDGGEE